MMKLNGWQRIGVVVSVLWAIGGAIYERNSAVQDSRRFSLHSMELCSRVENPDIEAENKAYWDCLKRSVNTAKEMRAFDETAALRMLVASLLPIVFGWLLALLSIKIFRWIRTGFGTNSAVSTADRSTIVNAATAEEVAVPGKADNATVTVPKNKTEHLDARWHTPLWLALIAFSLAVLFVANGLMAQSISVSPLAFLSDLPSLLSTLARHPDAAMNYLAEATGTMVVIPLLHVVIASIFPNMRNKTSRRRIFIGWSVVGAITATFL